MTAGHAEKTDAGVQKIKQRKLHGSSSSSDTSPVAKSDLHMILEKVGALQWLPVLEEAGVDATCLRSDHVKTGVLRGLHNPPMQVSVAAAIKEAAAVPSTSSSSSSGHRMVGVMAGTDPSGWMIASN